MSVEPKAVLPELRGWTAVAANAQDTTDVLSLENLDNITIFIDHARDAASAFVGAGTEYKILVSAKNSGDDAWFPIASFVCTITAASSIATDGTEAVGSTVIECGATVPAAGDYVFFKNATIANSEMGLVVARVTTEGSESFTLAHGLTYAQAAGTYYNQGQKFSAVLNVLTFKRLKVVCNNNNGSTNQNIVWRCSCIAHSK